MDPQLLKRILEAVLLAAAQPLTLAQLVALFTEEENVDGEHVAAALDALAADYAERGIELKEVASGFRFQIREDVHGYVTRLWTERQVKYSRALLETLALIAYRQPITRAEIEQIRGVAVSSSIIKTLEEREWVRVVGYRDVPGRPALFGTSRNFLDYFNLKSLDELPPLADIRDLEEYEPQLDLAPVIPPSLELPPEDEAAIAAEAAEAAAAAGDGENDDDAAMPSDTASTAAANLAADANDAETTPAPNAEDAQIAPEAEIAATSETAQRSETAAATEQGSSSSEEAESTAAADAPADTAEATVSTASAPADASRAEPVETPLADIAEERNADEIPDPDPVDDWPDADDSAAGHADSTPFADSDFSPEDDDVDPADPTTSDDVPEHTA